jgi:hypothetical protein
MPLKEKKRFMNPWKWITHPERSKSLRNARNTCFKWWKYGSGNWGYNVTDSTDTKPTAVILWVYLKRRDGKYICTRDMEVQTCHFRLIKKDTQTKCLSIILRNTFNL